MNESSAKSESADRCWRMHPISLEMIRQGYHHSVQNQFKDVFMTSKGPNDMALFASEMDSAGNSTFYFSPGCWPHARALMQAIGAEPCEKPKEKLSLLVGHANAAGDLL